MPKGIDCVSYVETRKKYLKARIKMWESFDIQPKLAIVTSDKDNASKVYTKSKQKLCEELGIICEICTISTAEEGEKVIKQLAERSDIHGIMLQLPCFDDILDNILVNLIPMEKDIDGLSDESVGKQVTRPIFDMFYDPATPLGILNLLDCTFGDSFLEGKHCVILGRSNIVSKPLFNMFLDRNATVTICHSKTENLSEITKQADVLVSAIGVPKYIKGDMVKPDAVVIDVGINREENGKLCGDVDFEDVLKVTNNVTPVPKGIGLVTTITLLENLVDAATYVF